MPHGSSARKLYSQDPTPDKLTPAISGFINAMYALMVNDGKYQLFGGGILNPMTTDPRILMSIRALLSLLGSSGFVTALNAETSSFAPFIALKKNLQDTTYTPFGNKSILDVAKDYATAPYDPKNTDLNLLLGALQDLGGSPFMSVVNSLASSDDFPNSILSYSAPPSIEQIQDNLTSLGKGISGAPPTLVPAFGAVRNIVALACQDPNCLLINSLLKDPSFNTYPNKTLPAGYVQGTFPAGYPTPAGSAMKDSSGAVILALSLYDVVSVYSKVQAADQAAYKAYVIDLFNACTTGPDQTQSWATPNPSWVDFFSGTLTKYLNDL
jgi:hypothetical protein